MSKLEELINKKIAEIELEIEINFRNIQIYLDANFNEIEAYVFELKKSKKDVWRGLSKMFLEKYGVRVSGKYIRYSYIKKKGVNRNE